MNENCSNKNIIHFKYKEECCGCGACYSICPKNAIIMEQDEEGFLYPVVQKEKCIHCGRCITVCQFKKKMKDIEKSKEENFLLYAVKLKNNKERMKSQSGGLFTALTEPILENEGKVYGCILNENFEAVHIGTMNIVGRNKMRGSKYVQSKIGECYKEIKKDLENKKEVLFTGTPCQVDGLKGYLDKEYENLYCVDIICHGVPSPLVWKDYVRWQENINKGICKNINFRNKVKYGWHSHVETFEIENENENKLIDSELYTNLFYSEIIVRLSCFCCPYKTINRSSDITIGDYWGIENIDKKFDDNRGVSIAIISSEKGRRLFNKTKKNIIYKKTTIENSLQPPLVKPFDKPKNRNKFWRDYHKKSFEKIIVKYAKHGIIWKMKQFPKRVKNKFLRIRKQLKNNI